MRSCTSAGTPITLLWPRQGSAKASWVSGGLGGMGLGGLSSGLGVLSVFPTPPTPPRPAGCVRQLRIQNEEVAFGELDLQAHGVGNCPTCQDQPCQVRLGGTRAPSPPSHPIPAAHPCPPSPERRHLRGRREQHLRLPLSPRLHRQQLRVLAGTALPPRWVPTPRGHRPLPSLPGCRPPPSAHRPSLSPPWAEACGPDATCVNRPDGQGYSCRCHLGKSGERCTEGEHGWGQGTGLGALWGQGHRGGDNAGDAGMGMGPLWGQGHGGGDNPRDVDMGDTSVGMG